MTKETRQQLFNYLSNELGVTALESNLNEIERIINPRKFPYIEEDNLSKEPISEDELAVKPILKTFPKSSKLFWKDEIMYITKYINGEFVTKKAMKDPNYPGNKYDWIENIK